MQTIQRYLINNLVIAYINGYHGRNDKVYDRRLTVYRGVFNPITFTFKNEDQKPQNIVGKTYEFNVIDTQSKKSVLTKTLTIKDDGSTTSTKGQASVEISDGDLLSLDAKFYNYSVRENKDDGSSIVTYADTGYNASGTIEIIDGAYPSVIDSTSITNFTQSGGPLAKTSGNINAKPGQNNNKALHTIAVYTHAGFSGALRIQGSMSASPGSTDWFDITTDDAGSPTNTFSSSTGVSYFNFTGVYHFVRFSWSNDSGNTGIIDKILYRQ